jgi:hypothetical protein
MLTTLYSWSVSASIIIAILKSTWSYEHKKLYITETGVLIPIQMDRFLFGLLNPLKFVMHCIVKENNNRKYL